MTKKQKKQKPVVTGLHGRLREPIAHTDADGQLHWNADRPPVTPAPANAADAYQIAALQVRDLVAALQVKFEKHNREFVASGSTNWGYVGDLKHYAAVLAEIVTIEKAGS